MASVQRAFRVEFEALVASAIAPEKPVVTDSRRSEDRKMLDALCKLGSEQDGAVLYGRSFRRARNQDGSLGGWIESTVKCTGPVAIDYSSGAVGDAILSGVVLRGGSLVSGGNVSDSVLDSFSSGYESRIEHSSVIHTSVVSSTLSSCNFSFCSVDDCELSNYKGSERHVKGAIKRGMEVRQATLDRRR